MDRDRETFYEKLNLENFLDFYNSFESVKELIGFMRSRKSPEIRTFKVQSDTETQIVAVIPTKSTESEHVKVLTEKLKGINIILVESRGPFFNFSLSMNAGIKEAIRLNSKFIMLSNDDIFPLDSVKTLQKAIMEKNVDYDLFVPRIMNDHSYLSPNQTIYTQSWLTKHIVSSNVMSFVNHFRVSESPRTLLGKLKIYRSSDILKYIVLRDQDPIFKKDHGKLISHIMELSVKKINKPLIEITNVQPVSIIRTEILKYEKFDESFVNGGEDTDLSIRLAIKGIKVGELEERFQNIGGYSLGNTIERILKNTIPEVLILGYKLNQYFQSY